jgi:hypothetical protein
VAPRKMWHANGEEEAGEGEEEINGDKAVGGVRCLGTANRGHRFDCAAYNKRDT